MRSISQSVTLVCFAVLLAACGQKSGDTAMKGDIVEKIERPGGGVAAISTRETVDAKTPPRIHVYLQKSQDPAQSVEVLDMERAAPLPPACTWTWNAAESTASPTSPISGRARMRPMPSRSW
jgi:hypothetical protein